MSDIDLIHVWCREAARRIQGSAALLSGFSEELVAAGVPLARMTLSLQTLHPQVLVAAYYWSPDEGITTRTVPYGADLSSAFLDSPIRLIFEGAPHVRRHLTGPEAALDFLILEELEEKGLTDYFVLPVPFSSGVTNAMTFATRTDGGFAEAHIATLRDAVVQVSPLLEIQAVRQIGQTVLETYLGKETGPKVMQGSITRGNVDTIAAVLWFCDLRDFTGLSERLPTTDVIGLLNAYFELVGQAIEDHGGEILKFTGDAVLAIFPLAEDTETGLVCYNALAAARDALAQKARIPTGVEAAAEIDFGIALHIGNAAYGNIGAPQRLDFTVIGPAVNLVSRIGGLCSELDIPLLTSSAFAFHCRDALDEVGSYPLKGIEKPETVYGLADGGSSSSHATS